MYNSMTNPLLYRFFTTASRLRFMETNLNTFGRTASKCKVVGWTRGRIKILNLIESLQHSCDDIGSFGECELFCDQEVSFWGMYRRQNSRPRHILGPPLNGRYSQPGFRPIHRSGLNSSESAPQYSGILCITWTE